MVAAAVLQQYTSSTVSVHVVVKDGKLVDSMHVLRMTPWFTPGYEVSIDRH